MKNHSRKILTVLISAVLTLQGCAAYKVDSSFDKRVPVEETVRMPTRVMTGFTQSLECMNTLLSQYRVPRMSFAVVPSQGGDGQISGLYDMLLVALSTISGHDNRLSVITDSNTYHEIHQSPEYQDPDFFIRIGSPQIDTAIIASTKTGGIDLRPLISNTAGASETLSAITVDLTMARVSDLQIVPGVFSNNRIIMSNTHSNTSLSGNVSLTNTGNDMGFGGEFETESEFGNDDFSSDELGKGHYGASEPDIVSTIVTALGASIRVNVSRKNGIHQSTRTLMELGALEIIGKHTRVPYWECLNIGATNAQIGPMLKKWYNSMDNHTLVSYIQGKLRPANTDIKITGSLDQPTTAAIARYQTGNGLIASGRPTYELYHKLMTAYNSNKLNIDGIRKSFTEEELPLEIYPLHGNNELYELGDNVRVNFRVRKPGQVYCYYEQHDGSVFQLFPNKTHKSPVAQPGKQYSLTTTEVSIVADSPETPESIFCYARESTLPDKYSALTNYSYLPIDVQSVEQIHQWHTQPKDSLPFYREYQIRIEGQPDAGEPPK